ncbi:hypothetical protein PENTCL1PPCAC_4493, partial [Pristionchus entomophagus]
SDGDTVVVVVVFAGFVVFRAEVDKPVDGSVVNTVVPASVVDPGVSFVSEVVAFSSIHSSVRYHCWAGRPQHSIDRRV